MKKVIWLTVLLLTLVCISPTLIAQVSKGAMSAGGGINLQSTTFHNTETSITQIYLIPGFDYFIKDKFSVGMNLGISFNKIKRKKTDTNYSSGYFSFGPYARYYVPFIENKFYGFGEAATSFSFYHSDNEVEVFYASLYLSPGLAYFVNERIAVEFGLTIFNLTTQNPKGNDNNITSVSLGFDSLSPSLGVRFFF